MAILMSLGREPESGENVNEFLFLKGRLSGNL